MTVTRNTSASGQPSAADSAIRSFAASRGTGRADDAAADPQVQAELEQLEDIWSGVDALAAQPAILAMREDALNSFARHRRRRSRAIATVISLLAVVLLGGGWWSYRHGGVADRVEVAAAQRFTTRTGQISRFRLADGSFAVLDTNSQIEVRIGASGDRLIRLLRGRALFKVTKLPGRKFVVAVGTSTVTALGTQFDVYRTDSGVTINLVEGKLAVVPEVHEDQPLEGGSDNAIVMSAGDRLSSDADRWELQRGEVRNRPSWISGQLVFTDRPVAEIVGELRRYTGRTLVIDDAAVAAHPVSAVIRTDDPLMFLGALKSMGIASVVETTSGYTISAAENISHPG